MEGDKINGRDTDKSDSESAEEEEEEESSEDENNVIKKCSIADEENFANLSGPHSELEMRQDVQRISKQKIGKSGKAYLEKKKYEEELK